MPSAPCCRFPPRPRPPAGDALVDAKAGAPHGEYRPELVLQDKVGGGEAEVALAFVLE